MSLFTTPLSQLTWADLQDLLNIGAVEDLRLEFKYRAPDKDETLKKLSAFANTYGGYMVVGATAASKDGKLVGLPGVPLQPNYKQTIVQWCTDGATPFIQVDVSDAIPDPSDPSAVCYVVFVAESDLAPHFLNGRKGVYIRTNEYSGRADAQLANENELRHLLDRRRLIRERRAGLISRARKRFTRYHMQARADGRGCSFNLSVVPRFPAQSVCRHEDLVSLIQSKTVPWRGVLFPRRLEPTTQHESAIMLSSGSGPSMLEANVWGLLFYATEIVDRTKRDAGIHLYEFVGNLLVFLEHARMLLEKLGYVGPLLIEANVQAMLGVRWLVPGWDGLEAGRVSDLDDEVTFQVVSSTETLQEKRDAVAEEILRLIFFALNWPEAAATMLKVSIVNGYEFNNWPKKD